MPFRKLIAISLGAVWLGACAQSGVSNRSEHVAPTRQATVVHHRPVPTKPRSVVAKNPAGTPAISAGLASFYTEGTKTASGETFNAHQFTAAHRTLAFGTRLRVTNVTTGRSVMVRVNDRGPFIPGRVVDVSYSAAEALGMLGQGVAKVKLDVVQ